MTRKAAWQRAFFFFWLRLFRRRMQVSALYGAGTPVERGKKEYYNVVHTLQDPIRDICTYLCSLISPVGGESAWGDCTDTSMCRMSHRITDNVQKTVDTKRSCQRRMPKGRRERGGGAHTKPKHEYVCEASQSDHAETHTRLE